MQFFNRCIQNGKIKTLLYEINTPQSSNDNKYIYTHLVDINE